MIQPKTIQAITVRKSIIPENRRVVLRDVSHGFYLILEAETDQKEMRPTAPFTLFLQRPDFKEVA